MSKPDLLVQGMHGMGDNIHQRAVIRQLMQRHRIYLETSWGSLYHDLVGEDLILLRRSVALRTQTKNAVREADLFTNTFVAQNGKNSLRIRYGGANVMTTASKTVLEAMCQVTGVSYADADYRLPVPAEWSQGSSDLWAAAQFNSKKPLLVYRPLVARTEWRGSMARNADPISYAEIYAMLRPHFFVVSVADLMPGKEWIVGEEPDADIKLHAGELAFEQLAYLFHEADLVMTSSGFAAILAPAVGTPCISVVGGYENTQCHASGEKFAPMLALGPEEPCSCWSSQCGKTCDKTLDMRKAADAVVEFTRSCVAGVKDVTFRTKPLWASEKPTQFSDKPPPAVPGRATVLTAPPSRGTQAYQLWLQQTRRMARSRGGEKA